MPTTHTLTVTGRLSYPVLTYQEALERNEKSTYKKQPEQVAPEFNLLLTAEGYAKAKAVFLNEFIPELKEAIKTDQRLIKAKMTDKHIEQIIKKVQADDFSTTAPYTPFREVSEKSKELMPKAVVSLKVTGNRKQDLVLSAIVRSEGQLKDPTNEILDFPVVMPLNDTTFEMYAGCVAGTTLNFYAYMSGSNPGVNAGSGKLAFKSDATPFGGGAQLDEDALFDDEDDSDLVD